MFRRYPIHARTLLSATGEGNQGGGNGNSGGGGERVRASDLLGQYSGDAARMADKLADALNDNYALRNKRRDLEAEVAALRGKQTPEGATVLTGDDAAAFAAYRALGAPADVQAKLVERDTLAGQVAEARKREHLAAVAQAAGFKPNVLARFYGDREYELRDQTIDGKAVKVAFVKDDGGTFRPLAEYAEAEWADELPALRAATGGNGNGGGTTAGVRVPPIAGDTGRPANAGQSYVASMYKGPPQRG